MGNSPGAYPYWTAINVMKDPPKQEEYIPSTPYYVIPKENFEKKNGTKTRE